MNGIVSKTASRSRTSFPNLARTAASTICVMGGFIIGANVGTTSLKFIDLFTTQKISFSKINWISAEKVKEIQIERIQTEDVLTDLAFEPFQLAQKTKNKTNRTQSAIPSGNLEKLGEVFETVSVSSRDPYLDFQLAATQLRSDFFISTTTPNATPLERLVKVEAPAKKFIEPRFKRAPTNRSLALVQREILASQRVDTQPEPELGPNEILATAKSASAPAPRIPVVAPTRKLEPVLTSTIKETFSSAEVTLAPILSKQQKDEISKALLVAQLDSLAHTNQAETPKSTRVVNTKATLSRSDYGRSFSKNSVWSETDDLNQGHGFIQGAGKQNSLKCTLNVMHEFIRPVNDPSEGANIQICPERLSWISKGLLQQGWIKVEGTEHIPTLTLQPAPNGGSTLLADQNTLAAIALKSGLRIARGMGIVLGVVPQGFKVEFTGRAEETEYFEANRTRYFAILNAEPGAGVVELVSEADQTLSSTIFTPVLEDTVTYLDLVAPVKRDILLQVVKNGKEQDPEISGLTIGLSTQNGIQAITQTNGTAALRSVNIVNGFPVFVDVGSRHEQDQSFVYRYELKHRNKQGVYLLPQIEESSLYRWLKQVKQGLSDQGAMVVGSFNRKRLDGFKNLYHTKVEPLTAKFGLEPINYTILWDGKISESEPLEGDLPRFMSVQVSEGLSQVKLLNEANEAVETHLIPVSPRVIHVVSE